MKVIYKYPLEITDFQTVQLPIESTILSVANQNGTLCLWALVDPDTKTYRQGIRIFGTGQKYSPSDFTHLVFLGTVVMGNFVWHVFSDGQV